MHRALHQKSPMREALAQLFDLYAGGSGLFVPHAEPQAQQISSLLVLSPGRVPTTDVYLRERLCRFASGRFRCIDALAEQPGAAPVDGTQVFIVRHVPGNWLRWLRRHRDRIASVIFLMDDDIPGALRASELPFRYALKTAWRFAVARRTLAAICSEVWVSTKELADRYAASSPQLCEPLYIPAASLAQYPRNPVYFYHGSWAHKREIEWLVPIVQEVQSRCPDACFEIIGSRAVAALFQGIARVRVIAPMTWPDYLAYAGTVRYQLGLAPCLDSAFNRARSHVKLFDITRLGAAGIYSDPGACAAKVVPDQTGLLCLNHKEHWVHAICALLGDEPARRRLHAGALQWCERERAAALAGADGAARFAGLRCDASGR